MPCRGAIYERGSDGDTGDYKTLRQLPGLHISHTQKTNPEMKKSLTILFLIGLFSTMAFSQSTWIPEGDYRLYSSEYSWLPLKGVSYTVSSADSTMVQYTNYAQFNDFHGGQLQPPQTGTYTMTDSLGPFGKQVFYPKSDEVRLFKVGILLPNHPVSQHVYRCFTDSTNNVLVDAVSGVWTYSSDFQDSVLSFTLSAYSINGQPKPGHPMNAKTIVYGKNKGLISYSLILNYMVGTSPTSRLLYSKDLNFGSLPEKPEDVFTYKAGNEYHSIYVRRSYARVDSTFIIRKVQSVNKTGNVLHHIDSVYECEYTYYFDSTQTWRFHSSTPAPKRTDTTFIDLDQHAFLGINRSQTALFPFDSLHNQEYFIVENNTPISPFRLVAGRPLTYASSFTPVPPYAYFAQRDGLVDNIGYSSYYPDAGGPYIQTSLGFDGQEEILVFVKTTSGNRGVPLDPSLVNSLEKTAPVIVALYPNPAGKNVRLQLSEPNIWLAKIYSVQGQEAGVFQFDGDSHEIDLSGFESGVYFIHLTNGIYSGSARLVVLREN
jgi:hypothetical protein